MGPFSQMSLLWFGCLALALCWSARAHTEPQKLLSQEEVERHYEQLGREHAYVAIAMLGSVPEQSIPLAARFVTPPLSISEEELDSLIVDLESPLFSTRLRATQSLEKLGASAVFRLRKALRSRPTLETRSRLEALIDKAETISSADRSRAIRLVLVLCRIKTREAKVMLENLADHGISSEIRGYADMALRGLPE